MTTLNSTASEMARCFAVAPATKIRRYGPGRIEWDNGAHGFVALLCADERWHVRYDCSCQGDWQPFPLDALPAAVATVIDSIGATP
jgi:hypothetical protein